MNDNLHWPSLICGVIITIIVISLASIIFNTYFLTSSPAYRDGYYEAYKQFKQNNLEQSASNEVKLQYETELLKEKYK
jgi:xanthine/uracil permease